jgi:hypothetical protein
MFPPSTRVCRRLEYGSTRDGLTADCRVLSPHETRLCSGDKLQICEEVLRSVNNLREKLLKIRTEEPAVAASDPILTFGFTRCGKTYHSPNPVCNTHRPRDARDADRTEIVDDPTGSAAYP